MSWRGCRGRSRGWRANWPLAWSTGSSGRERRSSSVGPGPDPVWGLVWGRRLGSPPPGWGRRARALCCSTWARNPPPGGGPSHAPATIPDFLPQQKPLQTQRPLKARRILIDINAKPAKKPKKASGRGRAPAARTAAPKYTGPPYAGGPGTLPVVCGEIEATLVWPAPDPNKPNKVVRLEDGTYVTPRDLEVKGGKAAAKSWKMSVRTRDGDNTLRSWLAGMGEAFVATHMTFNRRRG